ncbi:MAG: 3-5 exonuclease [Bacillales bacterium]|jgi:3'-5' exoribonuclease|nr:3-5 exonuclease [Bacillales bacterium]
MTTKGIAHYNVNDKIDKFFLIKNSQRLLAKNGKPYLTIIFQDKTGEIEGKLWDINDATSKSFVPGKIVRVNGEVQLYQGKHQLRLTLLEPAADANVRIEDFIETAPESKEDMLAEVNTYIFEMTNSNIQRITRGLVVKYRDQFLEYPAATKNHHEFVSGLAYHVVSMLRLAKAIATLYPSLNKDLLYSGVILHDLGKVFELSGPVSTTYTLQGQLLGHISIMVNEIGKEAEELGIDGEEVMLLQHLVLSHHGKEEWGSPKKPVIKEAEILHYIDNLDAKMNMMDRALERVKPGEFTERVFALDNRAFYKPNIL